MTYIAKPALHHPTLQKNGVGYTRRDQPSFGTGKTSGRGQKGQNSRSGGGVRPGFEGGQMPVYMRMGKLRGSNKKMSMPMGPFRTHTLPVNVEALGGFDAGTEVTPELLKQAGILKHLKHPVKILGRGEHRHHVPAEVHVARVPPTARPDGRRIGDGRTGEQLRDAFAERIQRRAHRLGHRGAAGRAVQDPLAGAVARGRGQA